MKKRGLLVFALLVSTPAFAAYVPGMTCQEVGYFAYNAAMYRDQGESLKSQVHDLSQSLPRNGYLSTQHALRQILSAIYTVPALKQASPSDIQRDFAQSCQFVESSQ